MACAVVLAACATAGAAACAGSTPAPAAAPAPVDAPPAARAPDTPAAASGATRFSWSAGPRGIEVRTDVDVTSDGPASVAASAPGPVTSPAAQHIASVASISAMLTLSDPPAADAPPAVVVSGVVDSLVVNASTLIAGLRFRAASDARGVRVEAADPAVDLRCTAPNGAAALGALAAVREALPRIPAGLAAGARWRDTTVTASCAGPVLLVAQTVARYESAADPAAPGRLRVTRQSITSARGQGTAGIRPLTVVATGTARTVYALDPARGQLVDGSGEGRTAVTLTVSGVPQRFTQQTRTRLTVR